MNDKGAVLMTMDEVVFRKVLPEQIQMAIAAQAAPTDDYYYYYYHYCYYCHYYQHLC